MANGDSSIASAAHSSNSTKHCVLVSVVEDESGVRVPPDLLCLVLLVVFVVVVSPYIEV